jgi:uncharacterized protein
MTKTLHTSQLIEKYYSSNPAAWKILLNHSRLVTKRSLKIARALISRGVHVDLQFIAEAAMLHDIGIIMTDTPDLFCFGNGSYLEHGIKGKEILESEGLFRHARVSERHIGVGLTAAEIEQQKLPLPARDMVPETLEEQLISYADLYYSKGIGRNNTDKLPDEVRHDLEEYGSDKIEIFNNWIELFEPELS